MKTLIKTKESKPEVIDITTKIHPVKDTDKFVTALFYGRSGTGKTTLAGTFPKKMLLLDFKDRGTDSIKDVAGIEVIQIREWLEVSQVYWYLVKHPGLYSTLVLDTISGMQNLAILQAKIDGGQDETESLSKRSWGEVSGMMNQWLLLYRDLPMNAVFLAQDRVKNAPSAEDEDDIEVEEGQLEPEVGPALIPSVAKVINAAVKVMGNTYIRQIMKKEEGKPKPLTVTQYRLRIGPHPYYITKIRAPKVTVKPQSILDPSYDKIVKIMKGEK